MSRKWLPLAPVGEPGVWYDLSGFVPTRAGSYRTNDSWTTLVSPALTTPGTTKRAWCALLPADTAVGYIGTTTKLWQFDGVSTFNDRTGIISTPAVDWSFAQYGNISFATDYGNSLQYRDASTSAAFAAVTGSPPQARIIVTQSEQVLLFDLIDGAIKPDAFAACAPGDYTDWSGAGATTATRIRHRPGKITAAVAFKDYVLVFKQSSVYKLWYTGNNNYKWRVELIAIGRGAWGKHDVVNCGDIVVFNGPGGSWTFDGASFRPITDWFGEVPMCAGSFFSPLSQNVWFMNSQGGGGYAYNVVSDRWGKSTPFTQSSSDETRFFTGEPAALRAFLAGASDSRHPDYMVALASNLAVGVIAESDTFWGAGGGETAYLVGNVEGIGDKAVTHFSGVDVRYTSTIGNAGSNIAPGDTELLLDMWAGASPDSYNLNPAATTGRVINNRASSTGARRFDVNWSAAYARFKIMVPDTAGFVEIDDYAPTMAPDGEVVA
jgi:hypothetical protein